MRFRVVTPSAAPLTALVCDCSICKLKGFVHWIVEKPAFELLSGSEVLTEYRFHTGTARHLFCRVCGIHSFYVPRSHPHGIDVNVRCLDGDWLDRFETTSFDGKNF